MKIIEFGKENLETIVLLHGGGLSWWNYKEIAKILEKKLHVVIPVLDGHAKSEDSFESIETCARRIVEYIDINLNGHILCLCGLSLGGQIAIEIMAQKPGICSYSLIESASLIRDTLTNWMIGPTFSSSYFLISYRWFSKLQFQSLHMPKALFEEYYRDTCRIEKKDMISFLKASTGYKLPEGMDQIGAKVFVVVGGNEQKRMKQSAELLVTSLERSTLFVFDGYYHGDLSLNHPKKYVELLEVLMAKKLR